MILNILQVILCDVPQYESRVIEDVELNVQLRMKDNGQKSAPKAVFLVPTEDNQELDEENQLFLVENPVFDGGNPALNEEIPEFATQISVIVEVNQELCESTTELHKDKPELGGITRSWTRITRR